MKLTFNFQTLILLSLTVVLAVATAIWGAVVYNSIYDLILRGFDQKLLALAGGAAEFTDGDGHAAYQRPREIVQLLPGPAPQLWGWDASRGELVAIDPADGGALPLPTPTLPAPPRSIAWDAAGGGLVALSADGLTVHASLDAGHIFSAPDPLPQPADQLLSGDGQAWLRRGTELEPLTAGSPALTLAEAVSTLALAPPPARFFGIAASDGALLSFGADGALLQRRPLSQEDLRVRTLASVDGVLYAAGSSLLRIDPVDGSVAEDFSPGWYSEQDPWFAQLVPSYRRTREASGLTFLYTEVYLGGDQIRYIMDGSLGDDHSPPGYLDVVPPDSINDVAQAQTRGQGFVSDIREWEEWGLIKVSGEPIYDSHGRVVAIAGADVDIGVIREKTRYALFAVIFVGAGLLLFASSVSYRVSQGLTRPLREIKDSALRIAAGYHGSRVAWSSNDEIGQLAQSLDALSTRLAAQARQSLAYQRALVAGREQIALEHALGDLVAAGARALPPRMSSERPAAENGACAHGEVGMLWTLAPGSLDPLHVVSLHARVQSLAQSLLQKLAPAAAQDALFQTVPQVAAVGCWDSARSELRVRTREELTLLLIEADGSARSLRCADLAQVQLAGGQHLAWADGQVLLGPSDATGTAA